MKKSIIVLLVLAILAGIGLTSCKNEIQAPVDELVSISFGYDSSRALTASLQEFKVNDYYWFYESEKADGSGLKSGQTGAGLTNLTDDDAMEAVLANIRPANGGAIGLGEPVKGFSKGLWNFRLFAATVEVENNVNYFHPVYIGEARNVLIDNDNHTVKVVVSPFSAEFQLDGEYGNLKIGQIDFKEASSESTVVPGALTITDMVSSNDSGNWVEVSHTPDHNETENFDYFKLPAGTYLYTRVYSYNGSEITRGSVIVTVYPNLTTTVSGFVTELTTSFNFETTENPGAVNVSAEATIVYGNDENLPTSGKYSLAVDGQAVSKVEAEITKTAADSLIEQLTNTFKQTDTSMANINLGTTSTSMDLNLGVRTTATTASSVVYDINMTAVVTYDGGSDPDIVKETDVKSVPDYVTVTVDMQSGLSSVSVTHSGYEMKAVADIEAATEGDDEQKGDIWVGFYKYDSTNNKLYIKTKSFSPFVVNYVYATAAPMAKVIRYVYDKTNETVMKSATITSAAKETLGIKTDETRIEGILSGAITYQTNEIYNTKLPRNLLDAVLTGTLVTFMPRVNAKGMTANQLPESDYFYSGGVISDVISYDKEYHPWRAEFKITSDYSFSADELCLVGSYLGYCKDYLFVSKWGAETATPAIYVMKGSSEYAGLADLITYDVLLSMCSSDDEYVRPGFTCGAYLGSGATAYTLGKTIKVQLILTNDNFETDPSKRVEVVCAEVVTGFRPTTIGDDVTISYKGKDLFTASLQEFAAMVNGGYSFEGCTVTLNHDVDLQNVVDWTPIGNDANPFSGVFDGQGFTISNLKVSSNSQDVGLFGVIRGVHSENMKTTYLQYWDETNTNLLSGSDSEAPFETIVKNVTLSDVNVSTTSGYAGALAGYAIDTYFYNIDVVSGSVYAAKGKVGGVVGSSNGCSILNNLVTGNGLTVTGDKHTIAGIVGGVQRGYNNPDHLVVIDSNVQHTVLVENCTNNAHVIWDKNASHSELGPIGGIVGNAGSKENLHVVVYKCTNNGNIDINEGCPIACGIVGQSHSPVKVIYGCINNGNITGDVYDDNTPYSGIAGITCVNDGAIIACTNTGTLTNTNQEGKANAYDIGSSWGNIRLEGTTYADVSALQAAICDNYNSTCKSVVLKNITVTDSTGTLTLPSNIETISSNTKVCKDVDLEHSGSVRGIYMIGLTQKVNVARTIVFGGSNNSISVDQGRTAGSIHLQGTNNEFVNNGTMDVLTYGVYDTEGTLTAVNNGTMKGFGTVTGAYHMTFTNNGTISRNDWHTFDIETDGTLTVHNYGTIHGANGNPYALLLYGGCDVTFYAHSGSFVEGGLAAYSKAHTVIIYADEGTTINGNPWSSIASNTWHVTVNP